MFNRVKRFYQEEISQSWWEFNLAKTKTAIILFQTTSKKEIVNMIDWDEKICNFDEKKNPKSKKNIAGISF